jgi:hypothetical protein
MGLNFPQFPFRSLPLSEEAGRDVWSPGARRLVTHKICHYLSHIIPFRPIQHKIGITFFILFLLLLLIALLTLLWGFGRFSSSLIIYTVGKTFLYGESARCKVATYTKDKRTKWGWHPRSAAEDSSCLRTSGHCVRLNYSYTATSLRLATDHLRPVLIQYSSPD